MGAIWDPNGPVWGCSRENRAKTIGGVIKLTLLHMRSLSSDTRRVLPAICRLFRARANQAGRKPVASRLQAGREPVRATCFGAPKHGSADL